MEVIETNVLIHAVIPSEATRKLSHKLFKFVPTKFLQSK